MKEVKDTKKNMAQATEAVDRMPSELTDEALDQVSGGRKLQMSVRMERCSHCGKIVDHLHPSGWCDACMGFVEE